MKRSSKEEARHGVAPALVAPEHLLPGVPASPRGEPGARPSFEAASVEAADRFAQDVAEAARRLGTLPDVIEVVRTGSSVELIRRGA